MRKFTYTTNIIASPRRVWDVLIDVERWSEWTQSIREIERLDATPLNIGSRVRIVQPKLRPAIWTVTELQPEVSFTWISRNPGVNAIASHTIEHTADGSKVTLVMQFEGIFALIVGALAGSITRRYLAHEAEGLKVKCEVLT